MKYLFAFILGFILAWLLKPGPKPVYVETVTTDTVFAWRDTCIPKAQPKKPVVMKKRPKAIEAPTWDGIEWVQELATAKNIEDPTPPAPTWENMEWLSGLLDTVFKTYEFSTPTPAGVIDAEIITAGDLISYKPKFKPSQPIEVKFDVPALNNQTTPKNAVGILSGLQTDGKTFSPIIGVGYTRNTWQVGYTYLPNFKAHQIQGGVFLKF